MKSESRSSRRQLIEIPAKTVYDVPFMDTRPNSVYVRNNGDTNIYIGFHFTPSAKSCDLEIKPGSVKTYGEQNPFGRMLIYNDSANPAPVIVTSWEADFFDPSLLQGDIDLTADLKNTIQYDGVIRGFESSLPAGGNIIGGVNVMNAAWTAEKIAELLTAIGGVTGGTGGGGGSGEVSAWNAEAITEVVNGIAALNTFNTAKNTKFKSGSLFIDEEQKVTGRGFINFISNDGTTNFTIYTLDEDGEGFSGMSVKPGEVISDVHFSYGFSVLADGGGAASYRAAYTII